MTLLNLISAIEELTDEGLDQFGELDDETLCTIFKRAEEISKEGE